MSVLRKVGLVWLLVGAASRLTAQETTGTITGVATDQTGAVLPGVSVTVKNVGTGLTRPLITSEAGRYIASFLPVGSYEITFELSGFQPYTARNINLHVNDRLEVNGTLALGEQAVTVEVTAASLIVQATPAVQNLMGPTQVTELPLNNRNFMQLATLVPGVVSSLADEVGVGLTSVTDISVNGARRNGVNWLVDGASNVDVGSNITLLATPTLESIEEFKIITSSYAAEWPRSGGGVINVVTKSGTNEFRASAYEFFRNDGLNANSFFRNLSTDPTIANHPAKLRYNNFGYTLGGPVRKDKLFFFFSQEWRRIERPPSTAAANVVDPAWLNDPTNANYVAPALRDPNAVRLLEAWPAPNVGTNRFIISAATPLNTRQEVARVDYAIKPSWRAMVRYTHDQSETVEPGGLFFAAAVPNIATTRTTVPGDVFVAQLTTTINSSTLNEVSYQLSGNEISTENPSGTRNTKADFNINTTELFPENQANRIPTLVVTGLSTVGANQLYQIKYRNHTIVDNLSLQRGNHSFKVGGLVSFESKNENAANESQGRFTFVAGGGLTAFQNFLRGNTGGLCGTACTYAESERDVTEHLRWNRYEVYAQDSWRVRPKLTLDLGVRYSLYPSVTDVNDLLTSFSPALYSPASAPRFANAAGTLLVAGTGDRLNGIVRAAVNAHGRGLYETDKNNIAPRLGLSWDARGDGRTIVRGGYGIYYDQPLIGMFEQNSFTNPPFANTVNLLNPTLSNPAAGVTPTTRGVPSLIASSDPFATPRTMQWNVGVMRQLYARGALEVSYVGSRGDNLIRPVDINRPQPADVARLGGENIVRPFPGYAAITMRETTAKARYNGLLVNFRHEGGRAGLLNVAYTLSHNLTDATNDRDAQDIPQNPLDKGAEYGVARTDRTHVFSLNYVYELPFFRKSENAFLKAALGGWQVSGITTFQSGAPVPRMLVANTNGGRRGNRVIQIADPFSNLPSDRYFFNPAAFAPPPDGSFGNRERFTFRFPGRNQWDITLSKNWYPSGKTRLQFRADFINAFNHTQFTFSPTDLTFTCNAGPTDPTCAVAGSPFGQFVNARLPREIQLGLKLYWN
jgi:Carboxypeptidase regulatory-like domain/TonB dependent receptor